MRIPFVKYHGAGNDFVMLDDREGGLVDFNASALVPAMCTRRFGIGADGLIVFRQTGESLPQMIYYNSDGQPSSFCGNGARCFVRFLVDLGLVNTGESIPFAANDGNHVGEVLPTGKVAVSMHLSATPKSIAADRDVLDTGSPHLIEWCEVLPEGSIIEAAHKRRYSPAFAKTGINVNFVTALPTGLHMRTYERGVEDETLACGTGVTAAAISYAWRENLVGDQTIPVTTPGGELAVRFVRTSSGEIQNLQLLGPAKFVFAGEFSVD